MGYTSNSYWIQYSKAFWIPIRIRNTDPDPVFSNSGFFFFPNTGTQNLNLDVTFFWFWPFLLLHFLLTLPQIIYYRIWAGNKSRKRIGNPAYKWETAPPPTCTGRYLRRPAVSPDRWEIRRQQRGWPSAHRNLIQAGCSSNRPNWFAKMYFKIISF